MRALRTLTIAAALTIGATACIPHTPAGNRQYAVSTLSLIHI